MEKLIKFVTDRWSKEAQDAPVKIGLWVNYGFDGTGQSNITAQQIVFLAFCDKVPSKKSIMEGFNVGNSLVVSRQGNRKATSKDLLILERGTQMYQVYGKFF